MDIESLLESLSEHIFDEIRDERNRDLLRPSNETVFRWKLDRFEYGEEGIGNQSATGDYLTKQSWLFASIGLAKHVQASEFFHKTLSELSGFSTGVDAQQVLNRFVRTLTFEGLNDIRIARQRSRRLASTFVRELRNEPVEYGGEAELDGIVILSHDLQFSTAQSTVSLRPTRREDIEKDISVFSPYGGAPNLLAPSAIMTLRCMVRGSRYIQERLGQSIAIMRLFRVGAVRWYSLRFLSDSLIDLARSSMLHSGYTGRAADRYVIREREGPRFKLFWEALEKVLPQEIYESTEKVTSPLSIAYERYCDALLQDGMFERRVGNAVMGLEALLLGGERQDLGYRLRMRTAKLLSHVGYDPSHVNDCVSEAYRVRSVHFHGGHFDEKGRQRLARVHGTLNDFAALIIDFLRMAILCSLLTRRTKESLIELIDDSMIARVSDHELESLIATIKGIVHSG